MSDKVCHPPRQAACHAEWAEELAAANVPLDIAFKPTINDFRGRQNVEAHLVDWRVSEVVS